MLSMAVARCFGRSAGGERSESSRNYLSAIPAPARKTRPGLKPVFGMRADFLTWAYRYCVMICTAPVGVSKRWLTVVNLAVGLPNAP